MIRFAVVLALCAAPQTHAEPPVRVQLDVRVAVPVPVVPVPVLRSRWHRVDAPPRTYEAPRAAEWGDREAPPVRGAEAFSVPTDRVPGHGLCRIWYDDIPPDRQPPPMGCGRAHDVARRHGGRVIWAESGRAYLDGRVASASYGFVDFRGVPPDRLPPPGSCRVWFDGVPPDRQPPPAPCAYAENEARRTGGRLLYMAGP